MEIIAWFADLHPEARAVIAIQGLINLGLMVAVRVLWVQNTNSTLLLAKIIRGQGRRLDRLLDLAESSDDGNDV